MFRSDRPTLLLGRGFFVIEEERTAVAKIDHEMVRGERAVTPPQIGDANGTSQIVVAAALLTRAIRISGRGVHPSAIGAVIPGLD